MKTDFTDEFKAADLIEKDVRIISRDSEGIATKTVTVMQATTSKGTFAHKVITIDDETGISSERFLVNDPAGQSHVFHDAGLTRYRCAEMTVAAIKMLYEGKPSKVGFIGTGKTNLANCIAIKNAFGVDDIVIRGSSRNLVKNAGDFLTLCRSVKVDTSDDFRLLNACDIVVVCTSSYKRDECISADLLASPRLIVCLDCGYYLDESFREFRASYSDFVQQIENHYSSEFPFDTKQHSFIEMDDLHKPSEKSVVYLYGVSIADAVAAENLLEALRYGI